MTNTPQWPLLNNVQSAPMPAPDAPITEMQRDGAERLLHQAHRDGRITTTDFERRFTEAMNAARSGQLAGAIANIPAPVTQAVVQVHNQYRSYQQQQAVALPEQANQTAMWAHLSGLISGPVGPGLFYMTARQGSVVRKQAAKAFNFQIAALIVMVVTGIVFSILGLGTLANIVWAAWLALTVIGGVRAKRGEAWNNPIHNYIKVQPLPTDGR